MLVEVEDDLPDVSDNLFAVCPHGGCEEELQAAQRPVFREIHDDLVTAVRVIEPLKRDLSAHPLVLEWHSLSLQKRRFVVVAFHIRKPPWDMVLVELEEAGDSEELPFCLAVQLGRQSIHSDIAFCHELARAASDWVLFRLSIGDLTVDYGIFQAAERKELSRSELRQAAAEMKQVMLAAKAAKLAQGLTANKKRKSRNSNKRKSKGKRSQTLAPDVSDMEWNSASESGGSASDFGADTGSVAAPASSSAGPARRGSASDFAADTSSVAAPASSSAGPARSKRVKQSRSIPWGPFQIAPIVPAAGHSGWGAICGQHCDRGNSLSCKKAMNRGSLTDAECVLRLKRWLLAGHSDQNWPVHRRRSHHVELGGKGLQDFAQGMSEEAMDALVASWA